MAVLAHPDDESLGVGGSLAKYAAAGVDVFLVTATRGESGRYRGHLRGDDAHPGASALGAIREAELRAAAAVLGVRDVWLLDYLDQSLDRAEPREAIGRIAGHLRRVRPDVVVTFGPDGAYGHPDHVAISQFTTAAVVAAADAAFAAGVGESALTPHAVSKLYYIAWPEATWGVYQEAFRKLISTVDGIERQASSVARLGNHDQDRHARVLADRVARSVVPRVAGGGLRATEETCRLNITKRCGAGSRFTGRSAPSTAAGVPRPICSTGLPPDNKTTVARAFQGRVWKRP